jgi:hypothetical protein
MLLFIVFTIALAIVRSIFNQTLSRLPKDNWKSKFKRRLVNRGNQNDPRIVQQDNNQPEE